MTELGVHELSDILEDSVDFEEPDWLLEKYKYRLLTEEADCSRTKPKRRT